MDVGRRSIVQAGAAAAVAAPLLRPQEAQAGLPVDALCAGKACNSAPVLPPPRPPGQMHGTTLGLGLK